MQLSVDSYVAGPNGEMDWMTWNFDDGLKQYLMGITAPVDCVIMGRNLAQAFIPHWKAYNANPETADEFSQKMVDAHKVVFSKTLTQSEWDNTEVVNGDMAHAVNELKAKDGGDIIAYGGAGFVSSLIKANLIDEYHLCINPAAIGNGMPIFKDLQGHHNLKLIGANGYDCGIAVLCYHKV